MLVRVQLLSDKKTDWALLEQGLARSGELISYGKNYCREVYFESLNMVLQKHVLISHWIKGWLKLN